MVLRAVRATLSPSNMMLGPGAGRQEEEEEGFGVIG